MEADIIIKEKKTVERATKREAAKMLIPYAGIGIAAIVFCILPNVHPKMYEPHYWLPCLGVCAIVYTVFYVLGLFLVPVRKKLLRYAWFICVVFLTLELWDVLTLKTGIYKMPFIPSPDKVLEQFFANLPTIGAAAGQSVWLLFRGLIVGLILGTASGIMCGVSHIADYWLSALLKIIGPVPGLIWLPVFFVMFKTSLAGSLSAIIIASWFPVTLMLSNALKNTDPTLIERAQTLGASKPYIVFHVMLPNAIPAFTNALFMALAASFGALSSAELCGVKTGLALQVKITGTIANFGLVFAYVLAMIAIFSSLTAIMFAVRNWLLRWQRDLVEW